MERKKITFDSFIRGVILGVIIIGILMLLKRLSGVLLPFFIAWLITKSFTLTNSSIMGGTSR